MTVSTRARAFGLASLVGVTVLVSAAQGQSVTLNLNSPYQYGNGGEFVATPFSFPATPLSLTNDGNFQTFCVQSQVQYTPGGTYNVYFSPIGAPGGPALNEPTAYLYDLFIRGTLPVYDYLNAGPSRQSNAGALQYAIWQLEGQNTTGLAANPDPALTTFYVNLATTNAAPGNFYGVSIMVLYTGDINNPTFAQNQLVELPAPGSLGLLAVGGLMASRRRRA